MNKKINVFISVSILLNVLLIGIIVGGVMSGVAKPHPTGLMASKQYHHIGKMDKQLSNIIALLPVEKRKNFKKRISNIRTLKQVDKAKMKSARKNILTVFESEPFDRKAYQAAVNDLNKLHKNHINARINLMADIAQYLSPKERRQLSRIIMRPANPK